MTDKSLDIFLMVLFGLGGLAILTLAWVRPMPTSERILTTIIGAIGLVWVSLRALSLKPILAETRNGRSSVSLKRESLGSSKVGGD